MEVTIGNFKETLPEIEKAIKNSTFLAIDCEFSGLNLVSEVNAFDTPKQCYEKVRKNCKDFLVLQYGLSVFRYHPEDGLFKQQTYNFYIFRRPIEGNIPDQRFLCQTSSINFLINQGFDFNKLFKSGIPYLNIAEEAVYKENLEKKQKLRANRHTLEQTSPETIPIPDDNQPFINEIIKQLDEFLESDGLEVQLPKCNAFVRRLIYQTTAQKYKNKIVLQTKQLANRDRVMVATKFRSKQELEEMESKVVEGEAELLDNFVGFTKVVRLIVDAGKLVVGHNMCLDLLHTIDKFLTPLSENYEEFKECAHSLFSNVVDTKYMASSEPFKDLITSTVLKDLVETTSKSPFEMPKVEIEAGGQGYSLNDEKEHEAGYDAYITGLSFLSMWKYLGDTTDLKLLTPYINRINLMILRDNQYIHLGGEDLNPSRDHVFYLRFPKDWKLGNIIELFSPFGNVYVAWIDDTSAYIGLAKKDQAAVALSTLSQSDTYSIMTYSKRQMLLSGIKMGPASPAPSSRKRKMCEPVARSSKRLKHDIFGHKFEPIPEDVEGENASLKSKEKAKTFTENAWD